MILSLFSFPSPPSALCTVFGKRGLPCPVTSLYSCLSPCPVSSPPSMLRVARRVISLPPPPILQPRLASPSHTLEIGRRGVKGPIPIVHPAAPRQGNRLRGGGGGHKASVSDCLPLAAPIGLLPLLILTLCGPERVLVVPMEPPDDLSCLTTPGSRVVTLAVDQVQRPYQRSKGSCGAPGLGVHFRPPNRASDAWSGPNRVLCGRPWESQAPSAPRGVLEDSFSFKDRP